MVKLRIRRIDPGNWSKWAPEILQMMHKLFPRKLWWLSKDYEKCLENEKYIARLATVNNYFVGFAWGLRVQPQEELKVEGDCKVMHLFYLFIAYDFIRTGAPLFKRWSRQPHLGRCKGI